MTRQTVRTSNAPASPYFSQAVKAGPTIYVSGMTGVDPATNAPAGPTIQDQTRRALENCRAILREADSDLDDVVDIQVLLARQQDFPGVNEVFAEFFPSDPPARSVAKLGVEIPNILVSIRMTAFLAQ